MKTKELLGLVASLVLRCDDCVTYHIVRCREEGVTRDEFFETFNVAFYPQVLDGEATGNVPWFDTPAAGTLNSACAADRRVKPTLPPTKGCTVPDLKYCR